MKPSDRPEPASVFRLEMEIFIKAPPERVWSALVADIGSWWPRDFCTSPRTKTVKLDPVLGGRLYEDFGDGAGLVRYPVIGADAPRSLDLASHVAPASGGPAMALLRLELVQKGKTTLLKLSGSQVGRVAEDCAATRQEGWLALFDAGLRAYVES